MRSGTEEAGGLRQRREIVNDCTVLAKVRSKSWVEYLIHCVRLICYAHLRILHVLCVSNFLVNDMI